jgi:hypothetical protein
MNDIEATHVSDINSNLNDSERQDIDKTKEPN